MPRQLATERATLSLSQANRLLSDQAAHLTDETVRQAFLKIVPANAEIVALWKATSTSV